MTREIRPEQNLGRAQRSRQQANLPEVRAWEALRTLRDEGWPARRQHPIGRIIVDFAIVKARLVIEVDGSTHQRDDVAAGDRERDAILHAAGWRVLRVPAKAVLSADALLSLVRALRSADPSP